MIMDDKDRFGVWNTVSNQTLEDYGLKRKSDIIRRDSVNDYLEANKKQRGTS